MSTSQVLRAKPARWSLLAGVLATAALVAGCGGTSGTTASSGGDGGGKVTKIGVSVQNNTNPFFVAEAKTVQAEGAKIGAKVLSANGNQDVPTQSNQVDQFIREKVDFIVLDAVDSKGLGPAVLRAKQANIPVIAIDVAASGADATITTNNKQAGAISCQSLATQMGGKGNLAILDGTPIGAVSDRVDGCKEVIAKNPGIKIVASQRGDNGRDKALTVAGDILTANPNVNGFFAINDPTATGVELAAKQKGKDVIITSVDGAQVAVASIKKKGLISATAAQDPAALARKGVETGVEMAKGTKPAQANLELPTKLIDASSAATYKPWG
jgi:ribose transport system substrate-binding protein